MRYPQPFVALLSLCLFSANLACADDITTVPVYLPHYDAKSWSQLRGSVIASNDKETTYTIFCAPQTPPNCDLAIEFPFVFAENAETLQFHGTKTSTLYALLCFPRHCVVRLHGELTTGHHDSIADLGCTMKGTTAATCSGYSSLKSGYINGIYTGPTEVSWTSTMTGSEVQWGVLTLADEPKVTNPPSPTGADDSNFDDLIYSGTISSSLPAETNPSAAPRLELRWAFMSSLCSMAVVTLLG
ncbi:hypothetical protein CCHL11_01165 [Colletotrichum chlorophyti]|uniref:Uncharacterized protein n=1 Tax=Colletotrichum chlorophyti TaxID=708187 RepID=A0A1Q8S850_9PEZI|nr:hypothetical protein CCHL11_01165 [Colletotrichum chlorophyti]